MNVKAGKKKKKTRESIKSGKKIIKTTVNSDDGICRSLI